MTTLTVVHGARQDDDYVLDLGREQVRWYAYLHLFDADGNHRRSGVSLIGIARRLTGRQRSATGTPRTGGARHRW